MLRPKTPSQALGCVIRPELIQFSVLLAVYKTVQITGVLESAACEQSALFY